MYYGYPKGTLEFEVKLYIVNFKFAYLGSAGISKYLFPYGSFPINSPFCTLTSRLIEAQKLINTLAKGPGLIGGFAIVVALNFHYVTFLRIYK